MQQKQPIKVCRNMEFDFSTEVFNKRLKKRGLNSCEKYYLQNSLEYYMRQETRNELTHAAAKGKTEMTFKDPFDPCAYAREQVPYANPPARWDSFLLVDDVRITTRFDMETVTTKMTWPKEKKQFGLDDASAASSKE